MCYLQIVFYLLFVSSGWGGGGLKSPNWRYPPCLHAFKNWWDKRNVAWFLRRQISDKNLHAQYQTNGCKKGRIELTTLGCWKRGKPVHHVLARSELKERRKNKKVFPTFINDQRRKEGPDQDSNPSFLCHKQTCWPLYNRDQYKEWEWKIIVY